LTFQQDNASIHTARDAKEFFHDENLQVLDWAPYSPDLNIIEYVWHYLKEVIAKMSVARNKVELWSNVRKALQCMRGSENPGTV
jgi:transposase